MRFTVLVALLVSAATATPVWQPPALYNTSQPTGEVTTRDIPPDAIRGQLPGYIQICHEENWVDCIIVNAGRCRNMNDGFATHYKKHIYSLAVAPNTACRLWTEGCRKGLGIEVINAGIANLAWIRPTTNGFHDKIAAFQCWQSKAKPAVLAADRN